MDMPSPSSPIGVFDSGVGGLSVLQALRHELPHERFIYLADSGNAPYGDSRGDAFVQMRSRSVMQHLSEHHDIKALVIACNTATAAAVAALREALPDVRVVGIEPGIKPAAAASQSGRIAVLATESTARSERLARLIRQHAKGTHVDVLACPGWATRVETLKLDDPGFAEAAAVLLEPALAAGADQVVLGCTHYAFLAPVLEPIVAGRAVLVDVAEAVARQCLRLAGEAAHRHGRLVLQATASPDRLQRALAVLNLGPLAARLSGPASLVDV